MGLRGPYLTLMSEEVPQRERELREVFNGLRWLVRAGATWRLMPHDQLPWAAFYQQTQRWLKTSVFEVIVNELRAVLRLARGCNKEPPPPSWTAARCNRVRKVDIAPAMMELNLASAAKCI